MGELVNRNSLAVVLKVAVAVCSAEVLKIINGIHGREIYRKGWWPGGRGAAVGCLRLHLLLLPRPWAPQVPLDSFLVF